MKMHNFACLIRYAGFCALTSLLAAPLTAAPINYGDFEDYANGGVVEYQGVQEASATDDIPLFGPPLIDVNELDFNPAGFGSTASGGDLDITDGQLNFSFESLPGTGLDSLEFEEAGDYRFVGSGTAATQASFSLVGEVMITAINGVDLGPGNEIPVGFGMGAVLDAVSNPTPTMNETWQIGALVEFGPALVSAGFLSTDLVTAGDVFLNNTLTTVSEAGSLAFIAKKDFTITPGGELDPDNVVPEPNALLLASLAMAGFAARRR